MTSNEKQTYALPAGAVTGIGSLPHKHPEQAIRFVAESCPTIPFWPQLPQRSRLERIPEQFLGPLKDFLRPCEGHFGFQIEPSAIDDVRDRLLHLPVGLTSDHAAGFFLFERAVANGKFPQAAALKGQVQGPVTMAMSLYVGGKRFADEATLMRALTSYVARATSWQVERLRTFGLPVILAIDEPMLGFRPDATSPGFEADANRCINVVVEAIRRAGGIAALHCCGSFYYSFLGEVRPDIFFFDAHQGLDGLCACDEAVAFRKSGGHLAFGLVPTWHCLDKLTPGGLFTRWLQAASLLGDIRDVAHGSLITATCGLGLVGVQAAADSFALARNVGNLVHQVTLAANDAKLPSCGSDSTTWNRTLKLD